MTRDTMQSMRTARVFLLLASGALASGCVHVTYGVNPHVERLEQLVPGQSQAGDVLLALGEPRGKGAAHLNVNMPLRGVWFYEFAEADSLTGAVNLKMLVVFMNGDVYDGYLWFSSLDKLKRSYAASP